MFNEQKFAIKNANIESIQVNYIKADNIKLNYFENINVNIINKTFLKIRDDDKDKLIPKVEII